MDWVDPYHMDDATIVKDGNNFELKSEVNEAGQEVDVIKGFLATTMVDSQNDQFTKAALEDMASQINEDAGKTIDTVFPGADKVEESQMGNREHENHPAFPFSDTRVVPSFKLTKADVRELPDSIGKGYGLHVTGELNSDGLPADNVSAIKNSLRNGYLHSFSIEFMAQKVRDVVKGGKVVRVIEQALQKGAALTARPVNKTAKLTDAMIKSEMVEYIDETNTTGGTMPEQETQETKNDEVQTEEEVENPQEEENVEQVEDGQEEAKSDEAVDEPEQEESGEEEAAEEEEGEEEAKSLRDEIDEIKSKVSHVREENDELKEKNEELKSQIEDLKEFKSINDSIDEIKSSLDDISLEDGPRADQEQERFSGEAKADWKRTIDAMGVTAEHLEAKSKTGVRNVDAFIEGKDVSADEVLNYVK